MRKYPHFLNRMHLENDTVYSLRDYHVNVIHTQNLTAEFTDITYNSVFLPLISCPNRIISV